MLKMLHVLQCQIKLNSYFLFFFYFWSISYMYIIHIDQIHPPCIPSPILPHLPSTFCAFFLFNALSPLGSRYMCMDVGLSTGA